MKVKIEDIENTFLSDESEVEVREFTPKERAEIIALENFIEGKRPSKSKPINLYEHDTPDERMYAGQF